MKKPTHEEISERAHHLWQDGHAGADANQNWYDAERQLTDAAALPAAATPLAEHPPAHALSEADSVHAVAERSTQQRKNARAPKVPTHTGPRATLPGTGKPLWNQPHSS